MKITVLAPNLALEKKYASELKKRLPNGSAEIVCLSETLDKGGTDWGDLLFIDSQLESLLSQLETAKASGATLILIDSEGVEMPEALQMGLVDDVIAYPFRAYDLFLKFRALDNQMQWSELAELSEHFNRAVKNFESEVNLAERLQQNLGPHRLTNIDGVVAHSRYLAGMRSGGDHFDMAESKSKKQVSIILTDASSYGLSSRILSVLVRVAMKLNAEQLMSCLETVKIIFEDLALTLKEKDQLSIFYGIYSRETSTLNYINFGNSLAALWTHSAHTRKKIDFLPTQGPALNLNSPQLGWPSSEGSIQIYPGDRMFLLSDGWSEGLKSVDSTLESLKQCEGPKLINELTFRLKSQFTAEDDMPAQDCTAVVLDFEGANVKRLRA